MRTSPIARYSPRPIKCRAIEAALVGETGADVIELDPQRARESASQPREALPGVMGNAGRENR